MGQRPGLSTVVRKDSASAVPAWDFSSWKEAPGRGVRGALLEMRVSPILQGLTQFPGCVQPVPRRTPEGASAPRGCSLWQGGACLASPGDRAACRAATSSRVQEKGAATGFPICRVLHPSRLLWTRRRVWQSGNKGTFLSSTHIHITSEKESGARGRECRGTGNWSA